MIRGPLTRILHTLGISSGFSAWLIRDEFNDADTSPINTPRNAVPGPGTLVFTEMDGNFSIGSGILEFSSPTVPAYDTLRFESSSSFNRSAGRTLVTQIQIDSGDSAYIYFSNSSESYSTLDDIEDGLCFYFEAGGEIHVVLTSGATLAESVGTWVAGTPYKISVTQLSEGAMYLIKGGTYTDWTLLFVYTEGTSNNLYPAFGNNNADGTLNFFRFWDAGESNFSPSFTVIPGQFTQSASNTQLDDGGFELWSSSTNLSQWTENLNGTSSINREGSDIDAGVYAARIDIDGSNSVASVSQFIPAGSASDLVEVLGYAKSEPTGAEFIASMNAEESLHALTDTYSPYTDILRTGSPSPVLELSSNSSANDNIYLDNFSLRRITENVSRSTSADALIDFEFILPDTPVGLMLMQAMNENFFLFLYRLVLGILRNMIN